MCGFAIITATYKMLLMWCPPKLIVVSGRYCLGVMQLHGEGEGGRVLTTPPTGICRELIAPSDKANLKFAADAEQTYSSPTE